MRFALDQVDDVFEHPELRAGVGRSTWHGLAGGDQPGDPSALRIPRCDAQPQGVDDGAERPRSLQRMRGLVEISARQVGGAAPPHRVTLWWATTFT
jgi:hypothetical protein